MTEGNEEVASELSYGGQLFAVGPEAHKDLLYAVFYKSSISSKLATIIKQPGIVQLIDMRVGIFVPFLTGLPDGKIYVLMLVHAVGGKRKIINYATAIMLSFN